MFRLLFSVLMSLPGALQAATYTTHPEKAVGNIKSTYPIGQSGSVKATQQNPTGDNIKSTRKASPYYELRLRNDIIYLTPQICRSLLIDYKTPEHVKYKPGVDVYGKPVVDADINQSNIDIPKRLRIPIRYSRLSRAANPSPILPPDAAFSSQYVDEIPLGFLDFELESGDIKFNGKHLTKDKLRFIRQKCRELME